MSRIIRPVLGKPVKRISVDVDIQGQVQINGQQRGPLGETLPMSMFDVCVILANVLSSSLLAIAGKVPMEMKRNQIKPHVFEADENGHCKLCGEPERAECHKKGNEDAESKTES